MRNRSLDSPELSAARKWIVSCGVNFSIFVILLLLTSSLDADEEAEKIERWQTNFEEKIVPILEARCVKCHQGEKVEGEFDISKFADGKAAFQAADEWERVARRIRLNEMPPQGSPRLNDAQKKDFHQWVDSRPNRDLCNQLASDETQSWYKGHVMSRRLTQSEYRNAIRDLIGLPLLPGEEPPSDGAGGEGFDTVGDSLFTSTIHLESYLAIADRLIDLAMPKWSVANQKDWKSAVESLGVVLPKSLDPSSGSNELEAAKASVLKFARRAWRRPVSEEELFRLLSLFSKAHDNGADFGVAIREPFKAILISPHFLFVVETEPGESGEQRLTPHQLATRLALLIWSSVPDEELLAAAESGQILEESHLRKHVRRMLSDPRSRAIGENFGLQWLGLRGFSEIQPDPTVFPVFAKDLSEAMREEAVLFVSGIFRDDRPLTDLVKSNYTYLNGRLASHYGIDLPADADWQPVSLASGRRGGVITMASVLTSSSYPRRTSPVLRGRWILDELLGAPVPPPPPNVPTLDESAASLDHASLRQRLEIHRQKAECASCHDRMDPLGFGLENFDAIGRWRDSDNGLAIDSAGKLPSGDEFNGPEELKSVLMNRIDEFEKHFVRKLLGFALGRELNKFDACIVDTCLKQLKDNGQRSQLLIEEIALSYPFQYRYYKKSDTSPEKK